MKSIEDINELRKNFPKDRIFVKKLQNFLANSKNQEIFRFCRVPFGVMSSPFLLAGIILFHIRSYYPDLEDEVIPNTYVDNVFIFAQTEKIAIEKSLSYLFLFFIIYFFSKNFRRSKNEPS